MEKIKLTQYSKGAGCGCKIAPKVLEEILKGSKKQNISAENLIAGLNSNEDAAVYNLKTGQYLISTNDFFTPIVDEAFDFGRIAAANSISDVYAMGGKPIIAVAILGWPVEKLPALLAKEVLDGAKTICDEAGVILAGGHSIDSPEPFFGLSVNGLVTPAHLKKNSTANEGDLLYLSKKIGVGILSAATKRSKLKAEHENIAVQQMAKLNSIGEKFGELEYVSAMTDVTGFGLLGHLCEMADGATLTAEVNYASIPIIDGVQHYTSQMIVPDNTYRNWNNYENKVKGINAESLMTLCDPQTNGGLLVAVNQKNKNDFEGFLKQNELGDFANPIGKFIANISGTSVSIV